MSQNQNGRYFHNSCRLQIPRLVGYGIGHISAALNNNKSENNEDCCNNSNVEISYNNDQNGSNRHNKVGHNNNNNNNNNNNKDTNMRTVFHSDIVHIDTSPGVISTVETMPIKTSVSIKKCTHVYESYTHFVEKYDNWIHIFIRIIVPAMIMMMCNIIIIRTISKRPLLDESESTRANKKSSGPALRRRISSNTKLIVVVNLLFFVTCAPVSINRIYDCLTGGYNTSTSYSYLRLLALSHHSVAFAFYMWNGPRFRKEFFTMCQEVYAFFKSYFVSSKKAFPSISLKLSTSKA